MLTWIRIEATPKYLGTFFINGSPPRGEHRRPTFILGDFAEPFVGGRSPLEEVSRRKAIQFEVNTAGSRRVLGKFSARSRQNLDKILARSRRNFASAGDEALRGRVSKSSKREAKGSQSEGRAKSLGS